MSRSRGRGKGGPGKPAGKSGSGTGGGSRSSRRRRRGRGGGGGGAGTPAAARSPTEREFSCGGVVVRDGQCIVIQPVRPDNRRVIALPKGHPELGEDPPTAALREILEETGVTARVRERLGEVVYWYQRDGKRIRKTVRMYLCSHESGEPTPDGDEVSDARWVPLRQAIKELSFPGDRKMVTEALARTSGGR